MATPKQYQWSILDAERASVFQQLYGMDFKEHVSLGTIQGASPVSYGATIQDLAAADGEVLLYEASLGRPAELSASTVYLCSSSGSDTGTYTLQGLDADGNYQTANVTATGTTPVAVSGTWDHVQACIHTTAGGSNVGTVYVSTDNAALPTTLGDQIQTAMAPGHNYAINPVFMVPNNQVVWFDSFAFSGNVQSSGAIVRIYANRQGTYLLNFMFYLYNSNFEQTFPTPIRFFEGDKIYVTLQALSGTNTDATFGMNGVRLNNGATGVDTNKVYIGKLFS